MSYIKMGNLRYFSKNWHKYTKDSYILDIISNGLKLELNKFSKYMFSRFTYPLSTKENEAISAEIMKLLKKKLLSIAHQSIMNSCQVFSPEIKKMEVKK